MDLKFVSYLRKTVFVKRDLILKLYFQLTVSVQKIVYVIVLLSYKGCMIEKDVKFIFFLLPKNDPNQ